MGLCAFVNVVIFYANIKDVFIGIYNLIFKKQSYYKKVKCGKI